MYVEHSISKRLFVLPRFYNNHVTSSYPSPLPPLSFSHSENQKECGELYKYVLVVMCGGSSVVVLLVILFYRSTKLWHPREGECLVAGAVGAGDGAGDGMALRCKSWW